MPQQKSECTGAIFPSSRHELRAWQTGGVHVRSFPARSKISPRRTCEWQVSGDESGPLCGSTRPGAVGRGQVRKPTSVSCRRTRRTASPQGAKRQQRLLKERGALLATLPLLGSRLFGWSHRVCESDPEVIPPAMNSPTRSCQAYPCKCPRRCSSSSGHAQVGDNSGDETRGTDLRPCGLTTSSASLACHRSATTAEARWPRRSTTRATAWDGLRSTAWYSTKPRPSSRRRRRPPEPTCCR